MEDARQKHIEQCRKDFPPRPAEDEMIAEEVREKCGLPPIRKTADQGVQDMQARITMLKDDKAKTLDAMDDAQGSRLADLTADLNKLNAEIAEAETRLTEYKAQQGLN